MGVMKKASITGLGMSPEEERRRRMIKYTVAMSIRMVCIVLMLFVRGWWLALVAAGAILLPYVAVVIANNVMLRDDGGIERPGGVLRLSPTGPGEHPEDEGPTPDADGTRP